MAVQAQKARFPAPDVHGLAPAVGGQPVQFDGEDVDKQNGDEKDRHGHADAAHGHDQARKEAPGIDGAVDAHGDGQDDDEHGTDHDQFQGGRGLAQNDIHGRFLVEEGLADVALQRALEKAAVLHRKRVVQAQFFADGLAFGGGN